MNSGEYKGSFFYTHFFDLTYEVKSYKVFSYNSQKSSVYQFLTSLVRIELFKYRSNAKGIRTYLRIKTTSNWNTSEQVTGLRPTKNKNVFYGDRIVNGERNLLIFKFSNQFSVLEIDVYPEFYPETKELLRNILECNYDV